MLLLLPFLARVFASPITGISTIPLAIPPPAPEPKPLDFKTYSVTEFGSTKAKITANGGDIPDLIFAMLYKPTPNTVSPFGIPKPWFEKHKVHGMRSHIEVWHRYLEDLGIDKFWKMRKEYGQYGNDEFNAVFAWVSDEPVHRMDDLKVSF